MSTPKEVEKQQREAIIGALLNSYRGLQSVHFSFVLVSTADCTRMVQDIHDSNLALVATISVGEQPSQSRYNTNEELKTQEWASNVQEAMENQLVSLRAAEDEARSSYEKLWKVGHVAPKALGRASSINH